MKQIVVSMIFRLQLCNAQDLVSGVPNMHAPFVGYRPVKVLLIELYSLSFVSRGGCRSGVSSGFGEGNITK